MGLGPTNGELASGFQGFRYPKDTLEQVGLRLRISGNDLTGPVVVAFGGITIEDGPELAAPSIAGFVHRAPEILPALPGPCLGLAWEIRTIIVNSHPFGRTETKGTSTVMITRYRDSH